MCLITNSQICRCMCIRECTYFFYVKNRVDREIYSIDLCMSTVSLCLIVHLYLVDVAVKVLVLQLFLSQQVTYQLN